MKKINFINIAVSISLSAFLTTGCIEEDELTGLNTSLEPSANEYFTMKSSKGFGDDGSIESTATYEYDRYGVIVSVKNDGVYRETVDIDTDVDGSVKSMVFEVLSVKEAMVYEFQQGLITRMADNYLRPSVIDMTYKSDRSLETIAIDKNNNGVFEEVSTIYDAGDSLMGGFWGMNYFDFDNMLISSLKRDVDDDGIYDEIETYTYDSDNNLLRVEYDTNNDSLMDYADVYAYTYDGAGNIIRKDIDELENGPGIDRTWVYTYDDYNNCTSEDDGSIITRRSFDSSNRKVYESVDIGDDGDLEEKKYWEYNANGQLMIKSIWAEIDYMGMRRVINETVTLEYDAKGNIVKSSKDYDGDTSIYESIHIIEYDDNNRISKMTTDGDGKSLVNGLEAVYGPADGLVDESVSYSLTGNLFVYDQYIDFILKENLLSYDDLSSLF